MSGYSRRRLLAVGGAVTVGALAGCLDSDETPEATPARDGPVLETITLENLDSRSHTLDIIIQWANEIEYWNKHELDSISDNDGDTSSQLLDSGWPTDPGEFQLTVRLDDETRAQFSSAELPDHDCQNLVVLVSRDGDLSILTAVGGGACVDGTDDTDETDDSE